MHSTQSGHGEFARLLTAIRRSTGLSYQKVADAAGVDRSQVWRWEHSGSVPRYEPVRKLAAYLIEQYPHLADTAAALLPAAGYETPPGMHGAATGPPAQAAAGPPQPPAGAAPDVSSPLVSLVADALEGEMARNEADVWVEITRQPSGTPPAAIFTHPAEAALMGVTSASLAQRVRWIAEFRFARAHPPRTASGPSRRAG